MNITLITSIIDPPDKPLSYIQCRSVYTKEERFEQTKQSIQSVRDKIPDNKIILIECSLLSESERSYFIEHVDYFINIYDMNDSNIIQRMHSPSKSMGEGTMTIFAIQYLLEHNIVFDQFFKLSGRYWLNDQFKYSQFNKDKPTVFFIQNDVTNALTALYHLPYHALKYWLQFLLNSENEFNACIGYENLFARFLHLCTFKTPPSGAVMSERGDADCAFEMHNGVNHNVCKIQELHNGINVVECIGVSGNISVCGSLISV